MNKLITNKNSTAKHCPQTHGAGVYRARAIVNYYDAINTHYVSACEQTQSTSNSGNNGNGNGKSLQNKTNVTISPNPSSGVLFVETETNDVKLLSIKLFDMFGREVRSYEASNLNTSRLNIEKTGLSKGLYFVQTNLSTGEQQTTKWLITEE